MKYPNIEIERLKLGMDKGTLSKNLGVSSKTYSNWQKKGNIPSTKLEIMANLFNCSVDYLLNISPNPKILNRSA